MKATPAPPGQAAVRLLMVAYHCNPEGGSVSMIGWRWFHYMSRLAQVHLVTHIRCKPFLDPILEDQGCVTYVDTEWFARPLHKLSSRLFSRSQQVQHMIANLDFILFQWAVRRWSRKTGAPHRFDICHVPTPVSSVAPHRLGSMGLPTFLGPLNGGMTTPSGFPEIAGAERMWFYRLRKPGGWLAALMGTYRQARVIFSGSRLNSQAIGERWRSKIVPLCENGVEETAPEVPAFPMGDRLELLFVGRIVPVKGLAMVLDAIAQLEKPVLRFRMVGAGPQEAFLKQRAAQLGIGHLIEFCGYQPSSKLADFYRACHLHLLPSIRESGGATILEAMAQGRPTAALNHGGPSEYITPECGFLIDCKNNDQVTADLGALFTKLLLDRSCLLPLAEVGLERVKRSYTWTAKVAFANGEYQKIIQRERHHD